MSDYTPSTNPAVGWVDEHGEHHHTPGYQCPNNARCPNCTPEQVECGDGCPSCDHWYAMGDHS